MLDCQKHLFQIPEGVTYLNAATTDVAAEGRILRASRSLAFIQVDVRTEDGTHIATGRATYTIIRRRP